MSGGNPIKYMGAVFASLDAGLLDGLSLVDPDLGRRAPDDWTAEQKLLVAVLEQALRDLESRSVTVAAQRDRASALAWFRGARTTVSFEDCSDALGFDANHLRQLALRRVPDAPVDRQFEPTPAFEPFKEVLEPFFATGEAGTPADRDIDDHLLRDHHRPPCFARSVLATQASTPMARAVTPYGIRPSTYAPGFDS
jgi:hypothetical protein